jgi:hypothetical protein
LAAVLSRGLYSSITEFCSAIARLAGQRTIATSTLDTGNVGPAVLPDRTHLNLRLFNRRLTRLTLGFSKKLECLKQSVALSIAHYNFCRVHHSLQGETPAMAARLTDHVWTIAELLTESGQVGSEKWICPLDERTVSPPIEILKAA